MSHSSCTDSPPPPPFLLTPDERSALEGLVVAHGIAGAARIVGMSRAALQSVLLGRGRTGSVLQFRQSRFALSISSMRNTAT
jgi:hypothetical protein